MSITEILFWFLAVLLAVFTVIYTICVLFNILHPRVTYRLYRGIIDAFVISGAGVSAFTLWENFLR